MKYTAEELIERMTKYESDRSSWDSLYQECADYGMPGNNQITIKRASGQKAPDTFQTTGETCILELASGLYSYMFPTDSKAFMLSVNNEELKENDNVKQHLNTVTDRIHTYLIQSNFRHTFFEKLKSLAGFGTGCFYSEKGKKQPINFINFHMAGVYIDVDDEGNVDTVFRKFEYTARQAVMKFGKENLGENVVTAYNDPKRQSDKFEFFHACFPRDESDGKNTDPLTMDYVSYYVCIKDKLIVSESGYSEMPYQVTRFDKDALEKYGRSPMMKMLPDIKMLSQANYIYIKATDKMCDPPIVLPNDGSIWPLSTAPGGVIFKMPGGDDPFWFEFHGDVKSLLEFIERTEQKIKEGFFLDLFNLPADEKTRTATEIIARIEEKLRKLTPIIGRLQSEMFNPMIKRIIGVLDRQRLLPPTPPELEGVEVNIEYLGKIALVMKALEVQGFVVTMEQFLPLIEKQGLEGATQAIMDNYDLDRIARDSGRANGMPATWLKDIETRDQERQQRAEAQQAAQMAEQMPKVAKAYADAGKAPEEGSIVKGLFANAA